ncbi:MAG: hypothetical protein ACOZQL_07400 [Myxococcota bacterium]
MRFLPLLLLMACGTTSLLSDAGGEGCDATSCAGCCLGARCLIPADQDDQRCGLHGRQCVACGATPCLAGICAANSGRDAGGAPSCLLERPTTSCDDQGGPLGGTSADKGRCVAGDGGAACECAFQQNPLTGRCVAAPTGREADGGVCALEHEACVVQGDCCNPRHTCFAEGCHY